MVVVVRVVGVVRVVVSDAIRRIQVVMRGGGDGIAGGRRRCHRRRHMGVIKVIQMVMR